MEKHYYAASNCPKTSHHLDHKNCSCTRCCSHKCGSHQGCHDRCSSHCSNCRKNLCDTDFSIRLGGLQHGLNFRLRQLLWCETEFELDDGNKVKGTIVSVGSNFVEVLVEEIFPLESGDLVEKEIEVAVEGEVDKELTEEHPEEVNKLDKDYEERKHKKGNSWIFSINKIANFKVDSSCHHQCKPD